jgi:hypothetical protein
LIATVATPPSSDTSKVCHCVDTLAHTHIS